MASEFFSQNIRIVVVTALASLALSIWCIWADPVVNNDGVHYLRAADKILAGEWLAAVDIYSWPLYSVFISFVSKLTGAGVLTSAHILNTLLCAVLVVGFLAVAFELGADKKTLLVAAVVILAFPTLNKFRPFVIRDLGYVACYLWSLVYLFRYWRSKRKVFLLWWFTAAAVGLLFRIEAIAMLIAVPIIVISLDGGFGRHRWRLVSLYVAAAILLTLALLAWWYRDFAILSGGIENPTDILGRISDYLDGSVAKKLEILRDHVAGRYYLIVYVMTIVFVTLAEIIRRLALVYALLAWWGLKRNILFPVEGMKPLWLALIVVNTIVLIGSAFFLTFVIDRYALAVTVTILLATPFVLVHLWNEWREGGKMPRQRWLFPLVVIVCVGLGIRGLDVFTEKQFLFEAGRWVAENTEPESTLHSNNLILIYYSGKDAYHKGGGRSYTWRHTHRLIKKKRLTAYDYIVVVLGRDDDRWIEWLDDQLHGPPIKRFINEKGDSALIYKNRA